MEDTMMKKMKYAIVLISGLVLLQSCSDFFNTNPDDLLLGEDYISSNDELYSGYMGVAAKVADVADKAVILSELRGDLLEPTENAPQGLWEIYNYTNDNNNEFTNPSDFYDVVVNANDFIRNAIIYKKNNPKAVTDDVFDGFISATIRYKVWAYLMIGKLYGKAIYFDDPMVEYQPDHNYPTLDFDQLIDQLILLMRDGISITNDTIDYKINGMVPFLFSDVISSETTDQSWDIINPFPECLNIELDLWDENYDRVIDEAIWFLYADGSTKKWKITFDEHDNEWISDIFTTINNGLLTDIRINTTLYNYENGQVNDLLRYFSNKEPNFYYLRPTKAIMDRFDNQYQKDGITKGDKYRGDGRSYDEINGQLVYRKLTRYFEDDPNQVYKTVDNIYMYRAPDIHFFLMEALNQKHMFREAEALLNGGMFSDYYSKFEESEWRYPFTDPLIYDAFTNNKYPNAGVRDRVSLAYVFPSADSIAQPDTYCYQLDSLILDETCMESNGEARSYFAMIRMAKRWDDPSILASRVSAKYTDGKKEEVYQYLMTPDNWFIKFDLSNK
ncbi:hypothetical protein ACE01N_16855 [Saccharicrinis sp. FJH2]|uniref:hypothetical protein n=1 Tax=Saccharicrinis sp. FJH65 TaxID=3344659 RepID=UPI0035F27E34